MLIRQSNWWLAAKYHWTFIERQN